MKKNKPLALIIIFTMMSVPVLAAESQFDAYVNRDDTSQQQGFTPLTTLTLLGAGAGGYLACRSDAMAWVMDNYKTNNNFFVVAGNSLLFLLVPLAGAAIGLADSIFILGPLDKDFGRESGLSGGAKACMFVGALLGTAAGSYMGYKMGGSSPDRYGEEILLGSLAGALTGSIVGTAVGNLIFGDDKPKKRRD